MEVFISILLLLLRGISISLHIFFLARCFSWKNKPKYFRVTTCILYVLVRLAYLYMFPDFYARPLVSLCFTFILACILFRGSVFSHLVWSIFSIVISGVIDYFVSSIIWLVSPYTYGDVITSNHIFIMGMVTSIVMTGIAYYCASIDASEHENVSVGNHLLLLATPLSSIGIVYILIEFSKRISSDTFIEWLSVAASIGLLIICISSLSLYNRQKRLTLENVDNQLMLRTREHTQNQYQQMRSIHERIQRYEHDMKNHISVLMSLHINGEKKLMEEYIKEITQQFEFTPYILTGHPILDAIISGKYLKAQEENISLNINITLPTFLPISDIDLCMLFGNLLDNALEATCALTDASSRFIELSAHMSGARWSIICRNSAGDGSYRSFSYLQTTKKLPGVHGIGTKQIQRIAEAIDGTVAFELENGVFSALVMLPVRENNKQVNEKEAHYGEAHTVLH